MDNSPAPSAKHRRLGELLREARLLEGMRQTRMAELLGRRQAFVSKYESGTRGLDTIDFLEILEILKVTGGDFERIIAEIRIVPKE